MKNPDRRIDHIESLAAAKDFEKAKAELEKLKKGKAGLSAHEGQVYYLESLISHGQTRYQEALEKAQEAYRVLKTTSRHRNIAQVQHLLGNIFIALGDLKEAQVEIRDALASYRRVGDEQGLANAQNKLAQIFFIRSEYDRAIESLKEAINHVRKTKNHGPMLGRAFGNLGRIHLLSGEWTKAQKYFRDAIKQNEMAENQTSICRNLLSLGYIAQLQRKFKQAHDSYQKAYGIIRKKGLKREKAIYHEYSGELALELGNFDEASGHLSEAIQIGEEIAPRSSLICQSYRILAQLQVNTGKLDLAESSCQRSLEVSKSLGERLEEGIVYRILGEIYALRNNKKLSSDYFNSSISCLQKIGSRFELARVYLGVGSAEVLGPRDTLDFLKKAKRVFRDLKLDYYLGLGEFALAKAEFQQGDYDRSVELLNRCENLFTGLKTEDPLVEQILSEISSFRLILEKALAEKSLSFENQYNVFKRFLSEIEYQGIQGEGINQSLETLAKRIQADRGLILLEDGEEKNLSLASAFNPYEEEKTDQIIASLSAHLSDSPFSQPVISTTGKSSLFSENGMKIGSLLVVPLRAGEDVKGILYLSRDKNGDLTGSFGQNELNLAVAFADIITLELTESENKKLERENLRLKAQLKEKSAFSNIITQNPEMQEILWRLSQVKDTNLSILLEGETGTGKDQIAKAIHYNSDRKNKKFVAVNCAALPDALLENELFGHRKGAYTGASQDKNGLLEEADGGTVYLDEATGISPTTQIKLLRALEDKEITRLGETRPRKIDIRVISSTSQSVREQIEKGHFRKDLFFRLNTMHVKLPPLRERKEDIPLLVKHFIDKFLPENESGPSELSPTTMELLTNYDWPGNIRELENEVKRLVAIKGGESIVASDILSEKFGAKEDVNLQSLSLYERVALLERQQILRALVENNWVKKAAASSLRIPESSLRFKIKQHKIKIPTNA
jgi:transcriptional regulator with GAF, ATPase, and Fis domain/Tfp pilus assembly protein PilF